MQLKQNSRLTRLFCTGKILAAYMLTKIFYRRDEETIVLVGGNLGEKYEDNAAVFHQYIVRNYSDRMKIHWMYDPKFDYVKEQSIPNAVPLGSLRNYILFFRASYSVHGHSIIYDLAPFMERFIFLNKKTVMLHISHGIECFKKILIQKEDVPLLARCDYYNCASEYEYEIKSNEWGIPGEKLITTGMARFDRLPANQPPEEIKRILLMFTWREWLFGLSEQEFQESDYFKATIGLLQSEALQSLIVSEGVELRIILHPFMKKYEKYFRKDRRVRQHVSFFSFDELLIMEEVEQADMLITDYSSIAWDFLYMNKPIIFYTFDQEDFVSKRGTYLDLDTDLFGYKAKTEDAVLSFLSHIVQGRNFANPYFYMSASYIDFFDNQNCERLANMLFNREFAVESADFSDEYSHTDEFPLVSAKAVQYNYNK